MHSGTHLAPHVHIGGGHVPVMPVSCWCASYLSELTAFIHLNIELLCVSEPRVSRDTQSTIVPVEHWVDFDQ